MDLRRSMRKLWADHVIWTRGYIISAVAGLPDATAALNRLMKNQEDIGKAIVPYYGAEAGAKLTDVLKHAAEIATFLSSANPTGTVQLCSPCSTSTWP